MVVNWKNQVSLPIKLEHLISSKIIHVWLQFLLISSFIKVDVICHVNLHFFHIWTFVYTNCSIYFVSRVLMRKNVSLIIQNQGLGFIVSLAVKLFRTYSLLYFNESNWAP